MKVLAIIVLSVAVFVVIGITVLAVLITRTYTEMKERIAELEAAVDKYEKMIYGKDSEKEKSKRRSYGNGKTQDRA